MGVKRLLGWDAQIGPNRYALQCACFLPFWVLMLKENSFVELRFWNYLLLSKKLFRVILWIHLPVTIVTILLTNSRSGLLLLLVFGFILFLRSKKKLTILCTITLITIVGYNFLPEATKHRYRSILVTAGFAEIEGEQTSVDKWSESSAQGRIFGLKRGLEIFREKPIFGVGPGGFQEVSGNSLQAHNLIGQLFSETGMAGIIPFTLLVFSIFKNLRTIRSRFQSGYIRNLSDAIRNSLYILLIGSFFAHTLFFSFWLLLGVISLLSLVLTQQTQQPSNQIL